MTTYFRCSICQRVASLNQPHLECPSCVSLIGEYSPEPPNVPKGVIPPGADSQTGFSWGRTGERKEAIDEFST